MKLKIRDDIYIRTRSTDDSKEVFDTIDQNREYLREWLPWVDSTNSPSVIEKVTEDWSKQFKNGTDIVLGIYENEKYIGNIGLHDINKANSSAMIGYWISKASQGRGIMTDCVRALTDYGFNTLMLNRIYIYCAVENVKSRAIPERLGFVLEGVLQDGECLYGNFFDMAVYGMVKRNWGDEDMRLVFPNINHKNAAWDYRQEHIDSGESHINGSGGILKAENYESWLEEITSPQTAIERGWVNSSTYFAFVGNKIVGTIQIRHTLNDALRIYGGHIGYGIRPSERRKGYGAEMLSLALVKCRELGIHKALITCDKDNIASAKTAIKNGGILENEIVEDDGNVLQRYWITVK